MAAKRRVTLATLPSTKFDHIYEATQLCKTESVAVFAPALHRGVSPRDLSLPSLTEPAETKVKAAEMGKPLENGFEQDEFLRRGEE